MPTHSVPSIVSTAWSLVAVAVSCSACNVGLDPRRFESVEYGADRSHLEAALEVKGVERMRLSLPGSDGRTIEYVWLWLPSLYPHPDYAALMQDGRLVAIRPIPPQSHPDYFQEIPVWSTADLQAKVGDVIAQRPSLRWEDLEPQDSALPKVGPHPTAAAIEQLILGLPGLVLLPITWPLHEWMLGDADERREHVVAELLTIALGASYEDVVARIGEPTKSIDDTSGNGVRTCAYEIRNGNVWMPGVLLGFEAQRLVWLDLYWTDMR